MFGTCVPYECVAAVICFYICMDWNLIKNYEVSLKHNVVVVFRVQIIKKNHPIYSDYRYINKNKNILWLWMATY